MSNAKAVPSFKDFNKWSAKIAEFWFELGIELEVPDDCLTNIDINTQLYHTHKRRAFYMLKTWKEQGGASYGKMADALREIGKVELANSICPPVEDDSQTGARKESGPPNPPNTCTSKPHSGSQTPAETGLSININGHSGVQRDGTILSASLVESIMMHIAVEYLRLSPLQRPEDLHKFRKYLRDVRHLITGKEEVSSLRITVMCTSLEILEDLWQDYTSGSLNYVAQGCLVTDEVLKKYNLKQFKLVTTIDEEEYSRCKAQFIEMQELQRCDQTEFTTVLPTEVTTVPGKTAGFPPTKSTTVPGKTAGFTQTESLSDSVFGLKLETPQAEKDPDFKSQSIKKMITLKSLALDAVLKIDEKTGYSVLHTICINKDEYNANRIAIQAILAGHDIEQHRVSKKAEEFAGMTPSMILNKVGFTDQAFMGLNHMFGHATRDIFKHLQQGNVDQFIIYVFERRDIYVWQRMEHHRFFGNLMALAVMSGSVKAVQSLVERRGEVRHMETLLWVKAEGLSKRTRRRYIADSEHQLEKALCSASAWNNYSMTELSIREGADVNGYINGNTALHYAAGNGNVEIVKLLLASGAHINQRNGIGNSALHLSLARPASSRFASKSGIWCYLDDDDDDDDDLLDDSFKNLIPIAVNALTSGKKSRTANFLIESPGVNMQAKNLLRESPLYLALAAGNSEAVLLLSDKKARGKEYPRTGDMQLRRLIELKLLDVNINNDEGKTPLHQSVEAGDVKTVAWLLQLGADINAVDTEGRTPLHAANNPQLHIETALMLIERGAKLDVQDDRGHTPLHRAAMTNYEELVDVLLKRSVEIDAVDKERRTALQVALDCSHPKIALKLAVGGAKLDVQDSEGRTPLHRAAMKDYEELVDVLLKRSVEIDAVDIQGRTALQVALDCSHPKIALKLAVGGAKLDVQDSEGRTPLHRAAIKDYEELVDVLLKRSVEIDAVDKQGRTAVQVALDFSHFKTAVKLIEVGAKLDIKDRKARSLHKAIGEGDVTVIMTLCKMGADINEKGEHGKTLLHVSVEKRNLDGIKLLIDSGADVNRKTDSGCTALRLAVQATAPEERVAMTRILLEAGADVNIRDVVGKSPLDIAVSHVYVECADLLRQSGKYQR